MQSTVVHSKLKLSFGKLGNKQTNGSQIIIMWTEMEMEGEWE